LGRDGVDIAGDLPRKRREIFFESGVDMATGDLPVRQNRRAKHSPGAVNASVRAANGPFTSESQMRDHVTELAGRTDQPFWAVRPLPAEKGRGVALVV
jgi:hypothetical protein